MKLLGRHTPSEGPGYLRVVPEEPEDLWHLYNLVRPGDLVTATTFRKVSRERRGGMESERLKLKLAVRVSRVDYEGGESAMRVSGANETESEHVRLGASHTLELDLHRAIRLDKGEWDAVDRERVALATDAARSADLAALLVEPGRATLCLVGSVSTLVRARVETSLPRKQGAAAAGYDKALQAWLGRVYEAVLRGVDWGVVRCLLIAGPGAARDAVRAFLLEQAQRRGDRELVAAGPRVVSVPATAPHPGALRELLAAPELAALVADTKAARETRALSDFSACLAARPDRAYYGPGHVLAAHEMGAVQTLLLSDRLFRAAQPERRRAFVALAEEVRAQGGDVLVFSSLHASGRQLDALTGIAAVLKFPMPELEDMDIPVPGHELGGEA